MSDITKTVEQFQKLVDEMYLNEQKKYTVASLAPRFKEAANRLRQDLTINQAAFVIEQVAERDPFREVTASDLKELANEFYTPGTQFAVEFEDLLELEPVENTIESSRLDFEGDVRNLEYDGAHEKLTSDIYNSNVDVREIVDASLQYTDEELPTIRHAAQLIDDELSKSGKVSKISYALKQKTPEKLLFQVTLRTASSEDEANVFIPVEISNNIPLFPQVMATTEKVYTLDEEGINNLTADVNAAIQYKRSNHIGNLRSAEEFEIALRNDTMGKYAEEVDEFDSLEPKHVSLGHEEIEETLRNAVLREDSKYNNNAINDGRQLVERELTDLGFQNSQVSFHGDYEHGLTYKASVRTGHGILDIVVPVEENKSILFPPSQFAELDGSEALGLSKEAVISVAENKRGLRNEADPLMFTMSYPDLKKRLQAAAYQKQPKLAQKIIAIIDEKFGEYYRNAATDDYQIWLEASIQSYKNRCGSCDYYVSKTAQADLDYCNLVKTAAKNISKDEQTEICTRSTYADLDDASVMFDSGQSIKIKFED